MFKTFFAYFKIGWQRAIYYRSSFFLSMFGRLIAMFFIIYLWIKIFHDQSIVGGMTLSQILTYYLFAFITGYIIRVGSASELTQKIKDGTMQIMLLRPTHPVLALFGSDFAKAALDFLSLLIIALIFTPLFIDQFQLNLTLISLVTYLVLLALGLILSYLITALVSVIGFWLIEMTPMLASLSIITAILSGRMVPLTFFPEWAQSLVLVLPFRYLVYDPILAITGQMSIFEFWQTTFKALLWIMLFYLFNYLAWQKGFKRFDAVGN